MNLKSLLLCALAAASLHAAEFTAKTYAIIDVYEAANGLGTSLFEPSFAVNPNNAQNFAACWQKDTDTYIIACTHDGGVSWQQVDSPCGPQQVADLWIRFSKDGSLALMATVDTTALKIGSSTDGGKTWTELACPLNRGVEQVADSVIVLPKAAPKQRRWENDVWEHKKERLSGKELTFTLKDGALSVNSHVIAQCAVAEYNVNPINGFVYVAYQNKDEVNLITSRDGGTSWSLPVKINLGVAPFAPFVAVTPDGHVGVLYYDFRTDGLADLWLTIFKEGTTGVDFVQEVRLTTSSCPAFKTRQDGMYVRDYPYLDFYKNGFFALFSLPDGAAHISFIEQK